MNGCTIPYTPIAVDLWKVRQCQRVRLFFLSHVHLDQNCGLTSSWSMPIYCSPLSKKLLLQRFSLNPDVVHDLDLNVPHTIPLTNNEDVTMTVTLIDANHCPGSVMFFFEGYFGRILYTGDFRYTENMITTPPFSDIISKPIDALYMDNTYCSPKCVFPTRDAAQREILTIIEQHPKEKIVIGLRNLGKENLLIAIASHFGATIKVSDERYKTLELLNAHEQFSVTDGNCRIEVVPMMQVTQQNMDAWNGERPTIAILPTAIFTALGFLPFHGQRDTIVVPYSDHCSYAELHRFVAAVRPKSVIPIVRGGIRDPLTSSLLDRTSVECFLEYYDKTPMTNYHIPMAVLELMNQTPSRGSGCGRRAGVSQKADSRMKLQRPNARKRKSNENKPSFSGSTCNTTTLVPLEPKTTIHTKDADHSNSAPAECQKHLESKPKGDIFSSNKNTDKTNCVPAMKSSSSNAAPVAKSNNSLGAKLTRCASSDRLFSSGFRPHVKLRAARVASPDLRMQLKRKASNDLKRFYANTHSNLIRTRRVRLCSAHVCRTLCHSLKNCHSGVSRTSKELREPILEMNRGEETMFRFTDDLLRKLHSPKELQKDFDAVSNLHETNSNTSSYTNQRYEENHPTEKQSLCSFSAHSDSSSPTYVCRSPVVHAASSDVRLSSSEDDCATGTGSAAVMDLRNKGLVMSGFPQQCLIMTPSTTQVAQRSDFLQAENHNRVTNSSEFIYGAVERNLQSVVEPSFPSLKVSSAGITTYPMQASSIPLTVMDQYQEYQQAINASMFQLQSGRSSRLTISESNQPPSWNNPSSLVYSTKNSVDAKSLTSPGQGLERFPKRPCLEPMPTVVFDRPLSDGSHNALHSHSPAGTCGQYPIRDRSPVAPADDFLRRINASQHANDEYSVVLVTSKLCTPAPGSGFGDDDATSFEAAVVVEQTGVKELILDTRNDERCCSTTGKIVLHTTNPIVVEDKLPPKKNWRHRFGMSQLHKSHAENKWLEPNGVAKKLLVANGTAGNSRT